MLAVVCSTEISSGSPPVFHECTSDIQTEPIDTMKADYCVVVWAANLSEQTLFDLPLRHFDPTNDRCPTIIISSVSITVSDIYPVRLCAGEG